MAKHYDATPAWLRQHGLKARDAMRLLRALCTLADYEGTLGKALREVGRNEYALHDTCDALRHLVDGPRR